MNSPKRFNSFRSGFTLVELLVVLAVISILLGTIGTALRPGSPTAALQAAQGQVASMASQALGAAKWRRTNARLIIHHNPDNPERYLQMAGVVYEDPDQPGQWLPVSSGVTLPRGIFFVPDNPSSTATDWPTERTSSTGATMNLQFASDTEEEFFYIEWNSRGVVTGSNRVALSTAVPGGGNGTDGGDVLFTNPDNVRGLVIRHYGTFVMLNEAAAFGN